MEDALSILSKRHKSLYCCGVFLWLWDGNDLTGIFFLSGLESELLSGCRVVGLSGYRVIGLSGCRVIGLSGCRVVGLSGCR